MAAIPDRTVVAIDSASETDLRFVLKALCANDNDMRERVFSLLAVRRTWSASATNSSANTTNKRKAEEDEPQLICVQCKQPFEDDEINRTSKPCSYHPGKSTQPSYLPFTHQD